MPAVPRSGDLLHDENEMQLLAVVEYYQQMPPLDAARALFHQWWWSGDNAHSATSNIMVNLPRIDAQFAVGVYSAFAESRDSAERERIIYYLPTLCLADHDGGLRLWLQLARDHDADVRRMAYDELGEQNLDMTCEGSYDQREADLREAGLEWCDVTHLSQAYIAAEHHPELRYQPTGPRLGGPDRPVYTFPTPAGVAIANT